MRMAVLSSSNCNFFRQRLAAMSATTSYTSSSTPMSSLWELAAPVEWAVFTDNSFMCFACENLTLPEVAALGQQVNEGWSYASHKMTAELPSPASNGRVEVRVHGDNFEDSYGEDAHAFLIMCMKAVINVVGKRWTFEAKPTPCITWNKSVAKSLWMSSSSSHHVPHEHGMKAVLARELETWVSMVRAQQRHDELLRSRV